MGTSKISMTSLSRSVVGPRSEETRRGSSCVGRHPARVAAPLHSTAMCPSPCQWLSSRGRGSDTLMAKYRTPELRQQPPRVEHREVVVRAHHAHRDDTNAVPLRVLPERPLEGVGDGPVRLEQVAPQQHPAGHQVVVAREVAVPTLLHPPAATQPAAILQTRGSLLRRRILARRCHAPRPGSNRAGPSGSSSSRPSVRRAWRAPAVRRRAVNLLYP